MFLSVFPDVYHAAFHWQGLVIVPQFQIMFTKLLIVIIAVVVWEAGMAQWWEHSPPTDVAWDRFLGSTQYVGWVCCWFSSLLQEVFLRVLQFFPLLKNQHFQILIQSRFQWTNSHSVEVPLQIPTVLYSIAVLIFLCFALFFKTFSAPVFGLHWVLCAIHPWSGWHPGKNLHFSHLCCLGYWDCLAILLYDWLAYHN